MNGMFGGRRKDLRMWIVFSLNSGPKNGVEIMDSMERQSFGMWRPSPGSIYPMLENMVNEGTIRKREDGRYELTEDGKGFFGFRGGFFSSGPRSFDDAVSEISSLVTYMEELKQNGTKKYEEYREKLTEISERIKKIAD